MHSAPLRILGNDIPSKRRFRALIEGRELSANETVMGWLFGKALVSALQQDSERMRLLVPKLWSVIGYDFIVGSSFVDSLRDLISRSQSVRRVTH